MPSDTVKCEECGLPLTECSALSVARGEAEKYLYGTMEYDRLSARNAALRLIPHATPTASEATAIGAGEAHGWKCNNCQTIFLSPQAERRENDTNGGPSCPYCKAHGQYTYPYQLHLGDPCSGCGLAHDDVSSGPCALVADESKPDYCPGYCKRGEPHNGSHDPIVLHRESGGQIAEFFPASSKVASDTAPGVKWTACRGSANSHCMDDRILADGKCVAFALEDWTDRLLAALAASPTASDTDTAIPGEALAMIDAWEKEWLASLDPHWGDSTDWGTARDIVRRIAAASPKPDTDTPVDPSVEGVREMAVLLRSAGLQAMAARVEAVDRHPGHVDALMAAGGTWMKLMNDAADMLEALAAKPITGMDAGEVKARQCPHGEPLNACADCKREHQEATA